MSFLPTATSGLLDLMCVLVFLTGLLYWCWRMRDNLYFADFFARHWKIRTWRRHTGGIENLSSWTKEGLPPPEKELCDYYFRHIGGFHKPDFDNALNYLAITQQSSTRPVALWELLILFILTTAEAATTGAFVAPFISRFSTGNQITLLGYGGAVVLALMLLRFTHAAGEQMRRRIAIKNNIGPYSTTESGFHEKTISSGMDQEEDESRPAQIRFANRVLNGTHDRGRIWWSVASVIILSALLVAIFLGRVWENNLEATKAVMGQTGSACGQVEPGQASSADPFANVGSGSPAAASQSGSIPGFGAGVAAPPDIRCSARAAQNKGLDEATYDQLMAGDAAAFILAIIYLLTQAMGFYSAYRHSFYGDGESAYKTTRGEPSYLSLRARYVEPALHRASALLTVLRSELMRRVQQYGKYPSTMTIDEYYDKRTRAGQAQATPAAFTAAPPQPAYRLPAAEDSWASGQMPTTLPASGATTMDDLHLRAARRILAANNDDERLEILASASAGNAASETRIIAMAHALKESDGRDAQRRDMLKGL